MFVLSLSVTIHGQATAVGTQAIAPAKQGRAQSPAFPLTTKMVMQPVDSSQEDTANGLYLTVGKTVVIDLARPATRVLVGLGDFVEAIGISPTQIAVDGKASGETSLIVWDVDGGRQFFNVTVLPSALGGGRQQLRAELPGQDVNVTAEGSNVYLRGTVNDLNSSNRAVLIAGTMGKVINLLSVKVPAAVPQILLQVRFISVDRTKEKQLGINLFSTGHTAGIVSTGEYSPPTVTPGTGSSSSSLTVSNELNLFVYDSGLNLGATIQALEQRGLAESLAEPNILAENGKQASFLAGGEYPFPMVQGYGSSNAVTIAFKDYGIRLNFIPTITPRGSIHLQVAPEVSTLDFADAVTISGFTEPAITTRRVKTEIELADHQSFAIGGLLDNTVNETFEKIPFLGDIPVLGKFFQSMTRTKTNTELIVIVTPEIVSPVPTGTSIPSPSFPEKVLPSNSNVPMHTPDAKTADSVSWQAPAAIPVEQLIESMKPGPQMIDSSGSSNPAPASAASTSSQP